MVETNIDGVKFFSSYYRAIMRIPDDATRLQAFEAITGYMMTGQEPEDLDWVVASIFEGVKPNIDSSRESVSNGSKGGRPAKEKGGFENSKRGVSENQKGGFSKTENQIEIEREIEIEKEIEVEREEEISVSSSDEEDCPAQCAELPRDWRFKVVNAWNSLKDLGVSAITGINDGTTRYTLCRARLRQYGIDGYFNAVNKIRGSTFLRGDNKNGWTITFDWFVKPGNFAKVLEGNYDGKNEPGKDKLASIAEKYLKDMQEVST